MLAHLVVRDDGLYDPLRRAHWIKRNTGDCVEQMGFIRGHRAIPALPGMAGPFVAGVDPDGIAAVGGGNAAMQSALVRRCDDKGVYGRASNTRPDLAAGFRQCGFRKIRIGSIIRVAKEHCFPPASLPGDMMRKTGNDDAGKTGGIFAPTSVVLCVY